MTTATATETHQHVFSPDGDFAKVVASVPKSANFEFAYDGHSFFTLRSGEFVAVAR